MNRKFLLLSISLSLSVAAILLVIGCLYVFSAPNARLRFDLTAENSNGVSERMLNAIVGIGEPVRLTAFLYREDEKLTTYNSNVYMRAFDRLRLLINDLEARTSGDFSSLIIDSNSPLVEQQRLQQLHDRQYGEVIVLSTSDNHVVLKFDDLFEVSQAIDEQLIAARLRRERIDEAIGDAALRLSNANPFKVAVIKSLSDDSAIQPFLEFLERQGHTVSHVNSFSMVGDQDLVVVPGQSVPFTPLDFAAAKQWIDEDRHLFLALGSFTNTAVVDQWNEILSERGESFEEGLLCEAIPIAGIFMEGRHECAILEINGGKISGQHKINEPLLRAKRSLLFAGTRPVTFGNSANKYSQSRLLRTSSGAWIDDDKQGVRFARDVDEKTGIHAIAIASAAWRPQSVLQAGHLLLSGSEEIMREHLDYNKDWLATSIMFLLGDDLEKSGLRSINEIPFHPSREILEKIKSLTLYLLPGMCLLLSLIVWMRRK